MKLIEVSHNECVGCRLCEFVCSLVHENECSTSMSRIRIHRDEEFGNNVVSICMQCEESYCLASCAYGAVSVDEKTGALLIDSALCNGCEECLLTCPMGAIFLNSEKGVAFTCDLCHGDPECVKWCSRHTLTLKDTDITSPDRKSFMVETSRRLSKINT